MKRFLIVIGMLALLVVAALAIFIATFDADRYRPQLVKKMEEAIGRPVQLERIRLAWAGGVAIQLQGLRISDAPGVSEPLLAVESVNAVVRLAPLLHRRVQISWVVLKRPQIRVSRDAQGQINVTGLSAAAVPAAAAPPALRAVGPEGPAAPPVEGGTAGAKAVPFEAEGLRVEDGAVHWVDAASQPPADIWLRRIDVTAEPIAPPQPLNVEARAALGGERQNLRLTARVTLPAGGRPLVVEDVVFDAESLPLEAIASGKGWYPPVRSVRLRTSRVSPGEPLPIQLEVAVAADRPNVRLSGRLLPPGAGVSGSFEQIQLEANALPLEQLAPPTAGNAPRLHGRLNAVLQGSAPTLDPGVLPRAVAARGTVSIDQPVIKNLNIVRTVFEKIAVLPSLMERLKARLPAEYQQKLEAEDTVLEPIEIALAFEQGVLRLYDLSIQSDAFGLSAPAATVTLEGAVQAQALLRIDRAFSEALIRSVEELRGLTNANGELEIPIIVNGKPPQGIRPDLQYIGSRVVVNKAIDALEEWLGQGKQPPAAPGDGSPAPDQPADGSQPGAARPAPPTGEELLGQFLQRALTPKNEQKSPQ